ncbi:transaldolase family protein [Niallia taxi]|uniref:Fructose-6-phosphate aldolase n=1 Tax=Niallia taxi TaxID=2499688 RepID=A0A3S2UTZ0_9BACI|nr:transaldolase family protein [Niallia taxi]MCM3217876.1 fructose-6-phosphate aldolase [Niallia taxi]MDK8641468.1 transaldolase family protein [Niallia taxi]MED4055792.1 transaldolase family protein [Niallia taxi]MED4121454.1 transaldolase family protein [Niallia taxi]RVT57614.1 fructose-6-phosphate aldolase [Niallia taxi]
MKLFIDSADVNKIQLLNDYYSIDGVTTNPSIIVKEGKPYLPLLKDIQSSIGTEKELFVQAIADMAENIVEEAKYIQDSLQGNIVIKIPVTSEGLKAIKLLSRMGIRTLATTVYTPMNAYLAAKAGASYVAPYVNRIDNLSGNGIQVVKDIVEIFAKSNFNCEVLAASFKNTQQVLEVCLAGAQGVTASPDIIEAFLKVPSIKENVETFSKEWYGLYGSNSLLD